jgi:hypothetical protein
MISEQHPERSPERSGQQKLHNSNQAGLINKKTLAKIGLYHDNGDLTTSQIQTEAGHKLKVSFFYFL